MGGGNSGPECSLFQSAGKSDKEVSLGTMGMEGGGEERAPFTQGTKVMALAECRLTVLSAPEGGPGFTQSDPSGQ